MKIKELLNYKSKWTQGAFARDKNGDPVDEIDTNAVSWCLLGAIKKCYFESELLCVQERRIRRLVKDYLGVTAERWNDHPDNIVLWNDEPNRTFADISKLVQDLDI